MLQNKSIYLSGPHRAFCFMARAQRWAYSSCKPSGRQSRGQGLHGNGAASSVNAGGPHPEKQCNELHS